MIAIRSLRPIVNSIAATVTGNAVVATTTTTTAGAMRAPLLRGMSFRIVDTATPRPMPPPSTTVTTRTFAAAVVVDAASAATSAAATAPPRRSDDDGPPRTSVLMELTDRVGALHDVLRYL